MRTGFLTLLLLLTGAAWGGAEFDAVVDSASPADSTAVNGADVPMFATITEALAAAPVANGRPYRVLIKADTYREKIRITRPAVHLVGEGRGKTIISWDDTGSTPGPGGEPLGTWGSATLIVEAPGFRMSNLTVENAFDYALNVSLPEDHPDRVQHMQAVALMTTGSSDRAFFDNVTFRGFQDTLFVDAGRHYFRNCRIEGHVDFIFGAGQAVFENCDIVSRNRENKNPTGYVTAPSTSGAMPYGLLFLDSRFLKEPGVPAGSVRLGRPWHPGGDMSVEGSAVFINCFMDDHIGPEGYSPISSSGPDGNRIWFEVDERSRFFEYGSYGPGGAHSDDRPRLDENQAGWYSRDQVLNGWDPDSD